MKFLALILALALSSVALPGEKGNGLNGKTAVADARVLEALLNQSTEVRERVLRKYSDHKTNLDYLVVNDGNFSPDMTKLVNLISDFIRYGEAEMLADVTFDNDDFYKAFNMSDLKTQLQSRDAARVDGLRILFWRNVKNVILARNGKEGWDYFSSTLDSGKLGYSVNE